MEKLWSDVRAWSVERKLDGADPMKQLVKLAEEFGELSRATLRGDVDEMRDAVGDCLVVLTIFAQQNGWKAEELFADAYAVIKDRKGAMRGGVFVKREDLA